MSVDAAAICDSERVLMVLMSNTELSEIVLVGCLLENHTQ